MDFYTNAMFKVQKGRGLWLRDPISKFQDPLISLERIGLKLSNLTTTPKRWYVSGWELTRFRMTLAKQQTLITGILKITKQQI